MEIWSEIRVIYIRGEFICHCSYEDRGWPKKAGFYFHPTKRVWMTRSVKCALRLKRFFDDSAKQAIKDFREETKDVGKSRTPIRSSYRYNM